MNIFSKFIKNGGAGMIIAVGITSFVVGFLFTVFKFNDKNIFHLIFFVALPILIISFLYSHYISKKKKK